MKDRLLIALVILFASSAAFSAEEPAAGKWLRNVKVDFNLNGETGSAAVQIYFPKGYKKGDNLRTLIALHGYRANMREWEINSAINKFADDFNFVIVCPDMGVSIYETKFYPETTSKWNSIPGGIFAGDILVKFLKSKYGLASGKSKTGIFGLSTGGRGAVLLTEKYPMNFGAAAGLSGDYDPSSMTKDRLLTSVYGDYKNFQDRWDNDDNIMKLAPNLKDVPVYISHGEKDHIIPKDQSLIAALQLKKAGAKVVYKTNRYGGHDWKYWGYTLREVMEFFDKNLK